ncbi:MAG: hypothetical protein ACREAO_09410 [Nitrososphaera sp.]
MANVRIVIAQVLAGAAFVMVVINLVAGIQILVAGLAAVFGISTIALAVAAFVLSLKKRSYVVAGLLVASGVMFMIPALIATGYLAVIVVPGPILGVLFGLLIFGLGVAKGITTAMASTPRATTVR